MIYFLTWALSPAHVPAGQPAVCHRGGEHGPLHVLHLHIQEDGKREKDSLSHFLLLYTIEENMMGYNSHIMLPTTVHSTLGHLSGL